MAEPEYKRLIQSAKNKALLGFLAVVQRTMQDADRGVVGLLAEAKSGLDQSALTSVRHFLRQDGNVFLRRVDALFQSYLERAMQTMYVDMRPGLRKLSANELSLIDDEAVNHQIEVGRLAQRMREANEESIGRLNVIVSQLHGHRDAKERENPFRPYLPARAMYEAIKEIIPDEPKAKVLFEHLSNALIQHLPGYYSAIREVFESSGVQGKFLTQPSRAVHHQRYFGAPLTQPSARADVDARVMPGLRRVLDMLQSVPNAAAPGLADQPETVQNFIRQMFSPSKSFILSPGGEFGRGRSRIELSAASAAPVARLVAQLSQFQKMAASGQLIGEQSSSMKNQLSALRDQIDLEKASLMERMTVDVVAMLFEFILEDEQIAAQLRERIGRLQLPILKAAVLEPQLLHDEEHPARKLLNRMSTAAVAIDPATESGRKLATEIDRVVKNILADFDSDMAVFSSSVQEFEQFLADYLRQDNRQATRGIEAVETAEKFSVLLTNVTQALCDVLLPLSVDKRISDFIILIWPHVLVRAALQDAENHIPSIQEDSAYRRYRGVLPDLLWSIQEKADAPERTALIRMLPNLIKSLRMALNLIQLPEEESREILDQLVAMHTQVLRSNPPGATKELPSLEDLRQDFSRVVISWDRASWELSEPPQPRTTIIEEIFAKYDISAELNLGLHTVASTLADREFLAQTYLLGTRVEFRPAEGPSPLSAQLVWISTHRSLYLFKQDGTSTLVLYTFASLLEALRDETIIPLEYAPVFERAVDSLLYGAGRLQDVSA
jgi:hypothetical protein